MGEGAWGCHCEHATFCRRVCLLPAALLSPLKNNKTHACISPNIISQLTGDLFLLTSLDATSTGLTASDAAGAARATKRRRAADGGAVPTPSASGAATVSLAEALAARAGGRGGVRLDGGQFFAVDAADPEEELVAM